MTWVMWVIFSFQPGPTVAYPLEIYDREAECRNAVVGTATYYHEMTTQMFPKLPPVKVTIACSGRAKI